MTRAQFQTQTPENQALELQSEEIISEARGCNVQHVFDPKTPEGGASESLFFDSIRLAETTINDHLKAG